MHKPKWSERFKCPKCSADSYQVCRTSSGKPAVASHIDRIKLVEELEQSVKIPVQN